MIGKRFHPLEAFFPILCHKGLSAFQAKSVSAQFHGFLDNSLIFIGFQLFFFLIFIEFGTEAVMALHVAFER